MKLRFSWILTNVLMLPIISRGIATSHIIIHNGTDEEADQNTPSNLKMHEQIRFSHNDYAKLEREVKQKIIDFYGL